MLEQVAQLSSVLEFREIVQDAAKNLRDIEHDEFNIAFSLQDLRRISSAQCTVPATRKAFLTLSIESKDNPNVNVAADWLYDAPLRQSWYSL